MQLLGKEEKERIIRMIEEDKEFRYAMAGLIGIREILERLDRLEENQERLWEEVRELRKRGEKPWEKMGGLKESFKQLAAAVGMTLEHYAASFLERYLVERGYPEDLVVKVNVTLMHIGRSGKMDRKSRKIDLLCEEPLLVGEVATNIGSREDAEREVRKLLESVSFVEEVYGRKVEVKVLGAANVSPEAAEYLKMAAEKHNILLLVGREIIP